MSRPEINSLAITDCIARIRARKQSALAQLYDATAPALFALAMHIVDDECTASEVVSDVYMQVWQDVHRYEPGRGSVRTWLLVICRSRALDALRAERGKAGDAGADLPDTLVAHADPFDVLALVQRDGNIHTCLETLAPVRRQLLALSFFRGYSHGEISAITGIPLGSVKSHIRAAIRDLRECVERQEQES